MVRLFFSFYLLLIVFVFVYQLFGEVAVNTWLHEMLVYDKHNDYIGIFHVLEQLHQNVDEAQFKQVLAEYPRESNMPLALFERDQLPFESPVFDSDNIFVADAHEDILYYQLSHSDLVLRIGPMGTYQPLLDIESTYEQSFFAVLAVSVLLWMVNLQRKFNRLNQAATRLGDGDLSVRVSNKSRHRLGNLNQSFNLMAERIERLMKGHKSLTNAVAHELRTPVARIRFQLDMMYDENDETQRKEYMYGISDDINELSDLVDELLTYARFDREAPALKMQSNSLDDSLQNVIRARHFDSHLTLVYDNNWCQSAKDWQYLPFDPKNLERAIGNLLSNAQKYADSRIEIHVERKTNSCTIYVDDDGPGIPEADRVDIFAPFKRLDDSRTRATGGYGLGLAIVKQIAQLHGGEVKIEQAPIGGARFVVQWPIAG